ncbi:polyhydroxyalkanoate biosynthesis repressor PhaR [Bacillus sp. HMF5848]|uniref:polyhydroxyalkanoate biosynthesis repressor PhaR n=1 Tax=Bacillus sp. HMF5848 TaxID=2495421 RepID=UPI000F7B55BC|nr:polyhydroxyalkanoate biosynthesis repressor PhaR [Bacillus sp. HMF5848]RSK27520.1 polyhydroxyalkanoate biosynthesis repressor PhaR [Bacillus sp. HMF5848]
MTTYDPYDILHKYSMLLEKQMNDFIYLWTNNKEFVKSLHTGSDLHARMYDSIKNNQEAMANILNVPTKNDVANVANLTIQTEEKIEALEEQIWNLQDSINTQNKEMDSVLEVSKDIIKLTKQLKTELTRTKKEIQESKSLKTEIEDLKLELVSFREEMIELKAIVLKQGETEPDQAPV